MTGNGITYINATLEVIVEAQNVSSLYTYDGPIITAVSEVGRCRLIRATNVESAWSAWVKRLKLTYDKLLSSFDFNFNLRRYTEASVFGGWVGTDG